VKGCTLNEAVAGSLFQAMMLMQSESIVVIQPAGELRIEIGRRLFGSGHNFLPRLSGYPFLMRFKLVMITCILATAARLVVAEVA
jgi:hypothetical protein